MAQVQKEKTEQAKEVVPNDGDAAGLSSESQAKVDAATDGIDDLLADIDELLGPIEQSEALVAGFIQKGGE
jgi:ubiquitin-like protein Pup